VTDKVLTFFRRTDPVIGEQKHAELSNNAYYEERGLHIHGRDGDRLPHVLWAVC
jgi:hypothetical protein